MSTTNSQSILQSPNLLFAEALLARSYNVCSNEVLSFVVTKLIDVNSSSYPEYLKKLLEADNTLKISHVPGLTYSDSKMWTKSDELIEHYSALTGPIDKYRNYEFDIICFNEEDVAIKEYERCGSHIMKLTGLVLHIQEV